jgi:6-phosphogluconolactonase
MGMGLVESRRFGAWIACGALLLLAGCGQFFPPNNRGGGGGGGGTSSGDYLYIGNLAANNLGIAGFTFASSSLSTLSGSPFTAGGVAPIALAVTPNDKYLYAAGGAAQQTNVYPINSNGTLGTGAVAGGIGPAAIQIDTTGNWLIGIDALLGEVYAYQITSGGVLSSLDSSIATLPNCSPASDMAGLNPALVIAPNDNYVYASCGTAGIYVLSFSSSSGQLTEIGRYTSSTTNAADSGLAIATLTSSSSTTYYLLATETVTNGVRVFLIGSNGQFQEISKSPFSTGAGPDAVLVDSSNTYVYVANHGAGNISAFTLGSSGALTAISGSPFGTGSLPVALVEDKSKTYVAAICNGGNSDLETYTIGTGGALTSFKNSATGSDPTQASSVTATH